MNGILKLNWANIKSAVVYGLLTMACVFILSVAEGIVDHGSIFGVDWKHIVDAGAMSTLGIFVTIVSLVKNVLTTSTGKFLGIVEVIPDKDYNSK